MKSMNDLFLHFLQDIDYAEKQGRKALAKVGRNAGDEDLRELVEAQHGQCQRHVGSLEHVFETAGKRPRGKMCEAMDGLIKEVNEAISDGKKGCVRDAALIAGLQAMKHYEIARLGTLKAWAKEMGNDEAVKLLSFLVEEDKAADAALNDIAEEHANVRASGTNDDEEDDSDEEEDDDEAAADEEMEEEDEDEEADEEADENLRPVRSRMPAQAAAACHSRQAA